MGRIYLNSVQYLGNTSIHELFQSLVERETKDKYNINLTINLKDGYKDQENTIKEQILNNQ